MQWMAQPIWNAVIAAEPDLFLFVGDAIYGDWDGEKVVPATAESLQRDWGKLAAIPGFAELRRTIPVMATWDNHDYGAYNGGAEFELKQTSREIFLEFFATGTRYLDHDGVYDAKIFGPPGKRLQIILLDTRYFKGPFVHDERSKEEKQRLNIVGTYAPQTDPAVTLLGETQWQWLDAQLRQPADVRLIVSGTQIVPDEKGMDEWGNYPHERQRLFDLIAESGAEGVIILSGNVHFTEISRVDAGSYPLVEFTSSGMTHSTEAYAQATNSYRVAGPYAGTNFGVVEIDWDATPVVVTLRAVREDGSVAFDYQVSLDVLSGN